MSHIHGIIFLHSASSIVPSSYSTDCRLKTKAKTMINYDGNLVDECFACSALFCLICFFLGAARFAFSHSKTEAT